MPKNNNIKKICPKKNTSSSSENKNLNCTKEEDVNKNSTAIKVPIPPSKNLWDSSSFSNQRFVEDDLFQKLEDELEGDLFQEENPVPHHFSNHKKQTGRLVILGICTCLLLCIGILGWQFFGTQSYLNDLKARAEKDKNNYTTIIQAAQKPDHWNDKMFETLKQQALSAYDSTLLETVNQAIAGNEQAFQKVNSSDASLQQDESVLLYAKLFSSPEIFPGNIVALAIKDPNLLSFIIDYPDYKNSATQTEALSEPVSESIPVLSAADKRWGYTSYNNQLFALEGSIPTILSMIISHTLNDPSYTPFKMANWAAEYGYDKEPIRSHDSIFSGAASYFGINMLPLPSYKTQITNQLNRGMLVIIGLEEDKKTHYILGVSNEENGFWNVIDPLTKQGVVSLDPNTVKNKINGVFAFGNS